MRQTIHLLTLLACSFTAFASTFETQATCTVLNTVTDPNSCSLTEGAGFWQETAEATISDSVYDFTLNTGAGEMGDFPATGTATISGQLTGYSTVCFTGDAMGGGGGTSFAAAYMGDQGAVISNYQYLGFCVSATPLDDDFYAYASTQGNGYADLEVTIAAVIAPTPEPPTAALLLAGSFGLWVLRLRFKSNYSNYSNFRVITPNAG